MATNALPLSREEIGRYGRQLILPEWGVEGTSTQLAVRSASVLVVGVGGLGCPAALYLAAAGLGHVGLLDYDAVELGNLHRQVKGRVGELEIAEHIAHLIMNCGNVGLLQQILHTEQRVGVPKADSAEESLKSLNSAVRVTTHHVLLNSQNALDIIRSYDVVMDATDNVATRYLLNDACVLLHKPLVSGSALRFEGQLTVYNYDGGPCYRCIFPKPPPPHTVTNCSEGGVLGVVPGIIGSLQALEVMKIVARIGVTYSQKLLLFNGLEGSFQIIRLRPRQPSCAVCGDNPTVMKLEDYELFCGSRANDKERRLNILEESDSVTCEEYQKVVDAGRPHLLLDVREEVEFKICRLRNSINVPWTTLQGGSEGLERVVQLIRDTGGQSDDPVPVYILCRRGNDSQLAVQLLKQYCTESGGDSVPCTAISNILGGLEAWTDTVDPNFPKY